LVVRRTARLPLAAVPSQGTVRGGLRVRRPGPDSDELRHGGSHWDSQRNHQPEFRSRGGPAPVGSPDPTARRSGWALVDDV